jgi:hypothetical protein
VEERKVQLVEEAKQICQQRAKLLEQQQYDLAVKTINVEEALRKGEGVLGQQVRSPANGEYKIDIILFSL